MTNQKKKRVMTSFEIGDLKMHWDDYCQKNGVTSVQALCQVIQKLTGADPSKIPLSGRIATTNLNKSQKYFRSQEGLEKKQHRLYLTFSESELRAIESRALECGFERSTAWAVALIRANLTNESQFSKYEVDMLGESNQQLLAIGRNLNQIAHALNASKGQSITAYDVELVENLADAVKRHVKKVGNLLRSSVYRWMVQ